MMLVIQRLEVRIFLTVICLVGISALLLDTAQAKLETIGLPQLVLEADVVMYGRTIEPKQIDHSVAWMKSLAILKNKSGLKSEGGVPICNGGDAESVDFIANPGTYIVFVHKDDSCYSPIAGLNSVVVVKNGRAHTRRIEGQPAEQALGAFVKEIRALVH